MYFCLRLKNTSFHFLLENEALLITSEELGIRAKRRIFHPQRVSVRLWGLAGWGSHFVFV